MCCAWADPEFRKVVHFANNEGVHLLKKVEDKKKENSNSSCYLYQKCTLSPFILVPQSSYTAS